MVSSSADCVYKTTLQSFSIASLVQISYISLFQAVSLCMKCTCGCNYPVHGIHHCPFPVVLSTFYPQKEIVLILLVQLKGEGGYLKSVSSFSFHRPGPLKLIMERILRDSSSVQVELLFFYCSAMDEDHAHPLQFKGM